MSATRIFLLGMLAGAGAISLANYVFQRNEPTLVAEKDATRGGQTRNDFTGRVPVHEEVLPTAAGERSSSADDRGAAPEIFEPRTDAEWRALVGGMLEWEVDRRTGERLSAAQRDRLVSELARMREASLALQETPAEPGDPADLRERLARTLTLAQVDEAFRKELGVGVAEFVRQMNPEAVQDVSRPSQP